MIAQAPIRFRPYYKNVVWGGERICDYKGIPSMGTDIGESWEISAFPGHESVVEGGPYHGLPLSELTYRFGASLLGDEVFEKYGSRFPLLIKLIDANASLSVQVHPDHNMARRRHDSGGKTEAWYIIHAAPGARIYSGFNRKITPEEYMTLVREGKFQSVLAEHESHVGDVFFLPPGRVHSIGAGNLLAEIQESCDITYRIYDYGRKDTNGRERELHTDLAKHAIDYELHDDYRNEVHPSDHNHGEVVNCPYFRVSRIKTEGKTELPLNGRTFRVLMCVEGSVTLEYPEGSMELHQGHSVLIPAAMSRLDITGRAVLLSICP